MNKTTEVLCILEDIDVFLDAGFTRAGKVKGCAAVRLFHRDSDRAADALMSLKRTPYVASVGRPSALANCIAAADRGRVGLIWPIPGHAERDRAFRGAREAFDRFASGEDAGFLVALKKSAVDSKTPKRKKVSKSSSQ